MKTLNLYINEKVNSIGQWNTQDDFFKNDSIGKKIWDILYKYQKSHDPNQASKIAQIIEKEFKDVKCTITAPNTGKVCIKAFDNNDKLLAVLDEFEKDKIYLSKIQEFLDKINK